MSKEYVKALPKRAGVYQYVNDQNLSFIARTKTKKMKNNRFYLVVYYEDDAGLLDPYIYFYKDLIESGWLRSRKQFEESDIRGIFKIKLEESE